MSAFVTNISCDKSHVNGSCISNRSLLTLPIVWEWCLCQIFHVIKAMVRILVSETRFRSLNVMIVETCEKLHKLFTH